MSQNSANAEEIVQNAINAAGQAGGRDEVAAIAARGAGAMTFSEEEMATLVAYFGSVCDALYAIQREAQYRMSEDYGDDALLREENARVQS